MTRLSSMLGVGSPLGWLCATMIDAAEAMMASLYTYRLFGTTACFATPSRQAPLILVGAYSEARSLLEDDLKGSERINP